MRDKELLVLIDDLTPENAHERGYRWFADKIYDSDAPRIVQTELLAWVRKGGVIGMPAGRCGSDLGVGIYEPLLTSSIRR
jgi:hypothetical protein